jgi:hypothetical protein
VHSGLALADDELMHRNHVENQVAESQIVDKITENVELL